MRDLAETWQPGAGRRGQASVGHYRGLKGMDQRVI